MPKISFFSMFYTGSYLGLSHHSFLAQFLEKWAAEPIKFLYIPTSIFIFNKAGFPTLSRSHQEFLLRLMKQKDVQYIITGEPHHPEGLSVYLQYLLFLYKKRPEWTYQEKYEYPYYNYLQTPLQPLMDNLESQTYEVFEQDPVKYREYENAAYLAIKDLDPELKLPVVMVVGAGRGPLVRRVRSAAQRANRKIQVYCVEKNPNAVVTLQNAKVSEKWDNVTIVAGDMRDWESPVLADIQVSELLGSFGDNELSPECLDGAQKYLKPDGVSIPQAYTSTLAPISTNKIFNEIRALGGMSNSNSKRMSLFILREKEKTKRKPSNPRYYTASYIISHCCGGGKSRGDFSFDKKDFVFPLLYKMRVFFSFRFSFQRYELSFCSLCWI